MIENKELNKFYTDIQEEVKSGLLSEEKGATPEQLFTEEALSILADSGETENYRVSYDEKVSKRGIEHKINAYALYENYETLDLFITIYNSSDSIQTVTKPSIDKALDRLIKFFRVAAYGDYVKEIEESSEIFDLAQTLAKSSELKEFLSRVNIFLITNGEVNAEINKSTTVAGYPVFYRIIDIQYLFNLYEGSGVPIEVDFEEEWVSVPCIENPSQNNDYQSYLAVIPGSALADIYEQYGPRLLEQNVRSFLQFTGKINNGIRKTILNEPHMFLAFNNGIAATAEEIKLTKLSEDSGKAIGYVKDFQIVNGGQTTASIYHTWKKDKADISKIFVQLKLTIIKDKENFPEIVGRIAEYANTQNKVSASDLTSNRENHVALEKLSRSIWAPPKQGENHQTRWFYERTRGQYKNERIRFGTTPARKKQFDKQNPKNQKFTKEQLAKYVNSYGEVYHGKKMVIGPHMVVRGNQKNYAQFLNHNFDKKPDNIFFENSVALAILFKSAEKIYGVKPYSIGEMRFITVPYSIAWLGFQSNYKLDLYKIWKNQTISEGLKGFLYPLMERIEEFIKSNAPGALYGEWAKKEECWLKVKEQSFGLDLKEISDDLDDKSGNKNRRVITMDEAEQEQINQAIEELKSIHPQVWKNIESWGRETNKLTQYQIDMANTIGKRIKSKRRFSEVERRQGMSILEFVSKEAPELFYDMESLDEQEKVNDFKITQDLIEKVIKWNEAFNKLEPHEFRFMKDLSEGKVSRTNKNLNIAKINVKKARKHGFESS